MAKKKKISELTPATSLVGLWSIGVDGGNNSVKISLSWLKEASDNLTVIKSNAEKAAGAANKAASDAGTAMVQISEDVSQAIEATNTAKDAANTAAVNAKSVSDHPGYIGFDYHVYTWDYITAAYKKTDTILRPEGFSIYRSYPSISAMNADLANVPEGKFVLINTNNVEQADNAKLYVRGATSFEYLVDMSGAIGFTGKTPQFSIGSVMKGESPSATISEDGIDTNGNPKYKINLVLPKGDSGANGKTPVVEMGTVTTGQPGSSASATLTPNGVDASGNPKYILALTIPRGDAGSLGTGDAKDLTVTFVEAGSRTNISSGETIATLFGKIRKWFSELKAVAFSGSYTDLTDKPTIPAAQVQPDWNATTGMGSILNKPTVPSKVSQLTNDSNFTTASGVDGKITAHNTNNAAHSDIRQAISDVEAIARGKSRAKVFDTVAALDTWLSVAANLATLQIGDNFYIKAVEVPDYWWDGITKQPIEAEKVDLTEYIKSTDVDSTYAKKTFVQAAVDFVSTVTTSFSASVIVTLLTWLRSLSNAFPAVADFIALITRLDSYTTATTVSLLPVDYQKIYVTLSANASLSASAAGVAYNGRSITAYVYCSSARTIAIPTTGSYVSMCGSSYTCPAGKWVEFSLECINGIWHIAKLEQE